MEKKQAAGMNGTILAYIGDAVYEVAIREMVIGKYPHDVNKAHRRALEFVSAEGQSLAAKKMIEEEFLTEEEAKILKRARNHRATSRPKNADPRNYKWATGFEALIGYLHLTEDNERLQLIIQEAIRLIKKDKKQKENIQRRAAKAVIASNIAADTDSVKQTVSGEVTEEEDNE